MLYERVRDLGLRIDRYWLERKELEVSSGFRRVTTTVVLEGGGVQGRGEDVTYEAEDHEGFPDDLPLSELWSVDSFSHEIEDLALFPGTPTRDSALDYRRWAFESAALDLALRQAGRSLGEVLGIEYRPVRFVLSTRLDIRPWLAVDPDLEFKLDPTSDWSAEDMRAIAATGRVRALDFKAYYKGTIVDQEPDCDLYRKVARAFPEAILEDPALTDEAVRALAGAEDRLAWDAPIHSVADIEALPLEPRFINIKPSRFGSVKRLMSALDHCRSRDVTLYGGGQFELGVGRRQIQALASLFYPDEPNDVSPVEYHSGTPRSDLPRSPLSPPDHPRGIGFD